MHEDKDATEYVFIDGIRCEKSDVAIGTHPLETKVNNSATEVAKIIQDTHALLDKAKQTNPKDALGTKKVPMHCVSCKVLMEMGLGMMEGGRKYGAHNYRKMGVLASVYYDAALRHLMDWWEGEDIDPDSGLHHVAKALSDLSVLRDSMHMGNWEDDRPIRLPDKLNIKELNEKAKEIIEKYPNCKAPYLQKDFSKR